MHSLFFIYIIYQKTIFTLVPCIFFFFFLHTYVFLMNLCNRDEMFLMFYFILVLYVNLTHFILYNDSFTNIKIYLVFARGRFESWDVKNH